MAFIGILFLLLILGMLLFGVGGAVASVVFALIYRKKRQRWMRNISIALAVCAAVNLLISGGFLIWMTSF